MTEHKTLTKNELAKRWGCEPEVIDNAIADGFIADQEEWPISDVWDAEMQLDDKNIAHRLARLSTFKDQIPTDVYHAEARDLCRDIITIFGTTEYLPEALNMLRTATEGAIQYE